MAAELELTTVPRDLYYVERALVERQAAEIVRLREALASINRQASDHNVTFDQWLRHVDGIADTARAALAKTAART